jgi:hypothetical protein
MSNIFLGVPVVASGTNAGLTPANPSRINDGSNSANSIIPNQVVGGPAQYDGYWTMDLGSPGTVLSVQQYSAGTGGPSSAVSLESSLDGVTWNTVVSGAAFQAAAVGDFSTVNPVSNNTSRRYWRLHFSYFAPGLGFMSGAQITELTVLSGSMDPLPARNFVIFVP